MGAGLDKGIPETAVNSREWRGEIKDFRIKGNYKNFDWETETWEDLECFCVIWV